MNDHHGMLWAATLKTYRLSHYRRS